MKAAVGILDHQHAAKQGSAEDGDIGSGLDQPGAGEHFVALQVLRQDGIFDRAEEGRMNPHRGQRDEQQRDVVEQQAGRAEQHDEDFGGLHDADDPRLVGRSRRVARRARKAGRRAG